MEVSAQRLEASLSQKLHELSDLNRRLAEQENDDSSMLDDAENPIGSEVACMEKEANDLLSQLDSLIAKYDSPTGMSLSASQRVLLQGLRDVHRRESAELRRLSSSIKHKLDSAQLMAGVWRGGKDDLGAVDHLLRERNSIHNSSSLVDSALEQAAETRLALDRQKRLLQKGSSNLSQLLGLFPAANNFINRIRTKQQRDRLILAGVVALCLLFCVWWVFG